MPGSGANVPCLVSSLVEHWLFSRSWLPGLLVPPHLCGVGMRVPGAGAGWAHCWVLRKRTVHLAAAVAVVMVVRLSLQGWSPVIPVRAVVLGCLVVGWAGCLVVVCELHSGREHLCGQVV